MSEKDNLHMFMDNIQYVGRMIKRNDRAGSMPYGITKTQWFILRILAKKSCTIGELAQKMEVRPSSMSQMIDRMELASLVSRQTDHKDARSKKIVLMEEGRKHLLELSHNRMELLSTPFSKLSEVEQTTLVQLMEKFRKNLSSSFEGEER